MTQIALNKLTKLAPGRYVESTFYEAMKPWNKALCKAVAVGSLDNKFVLSHQSAARLHGFDVLHVEEKTHVRTSSRQSTVCKQIAVHAYQDPIDVVQVCGINVTHPAQAIIDCCRALSYREALPIVDSAFKMGVTKPYLEEYLADMEFSRGRKKVYRALNNATHLSGSAGESECRVALDEVGMPKPSLQHRIYARGKNYFADFAYPDFGLVIEFDGLVKYGNFGHDASRVMRDELIREKRLRSAGWEVVRFTTQDIRDEDVLRASLMPYLQISGFVGKKSTFSRRTH